VIPAESPLIATPTKAHRCIPGSCESSKCAATGEQLGCPRCWVAAAGDELLGQPVHLSAQPIEGPPHSEPVSLQALTDNVREDPVVLP
jgi:hypothetical protein